MEWLRHPCSHCLTRLPFDIAAKANAQTEFYEVFMLDQDFAIERPKRVYRTGFHLLTGKSLKHKEGDPSKAIQPEHEGEIDTENPFTQEMMIQNGEGKGQGADQMQDEEEIRASQHTFFISNSQRKLKLVTKNAVRLRHKLWGGRELTISDKCISSLFRWSGSQLNQHGRG